MKVLYCIVCNKDVFDFRHLTDGELINILEHSPDQVCGRFQKSQLGRVLNKRNGVESTNPKYHRMLTALLALSATVGVSHAGSSIDLSSVEPEVGISPNDNLSVSEYNNQKDSLKTNVLGGKVLDDSRSEFIGVSVSIDKTSIGTVTNMDGKFELTIPESYLQNISIPLNINHIGCKSKRLVVPMDKISELQAIILEESEMELMGIVVIGTSRYYDPIYKK